MVLDVAECHKTEAEILDTYAISDACSADLRPAALQKEAKEAKKASSADKTPASKSSTRPASKRSKRK